MMTYECLYCGVTYRRVAEKHSCDICGHSSESGWFCEVQQAEPIPFNRKALGKKAAQRKSA